MSKKIYNKEFKFKVAIEMVRGDLTVAEICAKYEVAASVAARWRKQLLDNGSNLFAGPISKNSPRSNSGDIEKLHAAIGRLKVENDFLHQVSSKLNL